MSDPDKKPDPPEAVCENADQESLGQEMETDNLIATYECVAEWIRFADAKAAAVLTVAGAGIGVLVPTLRTYLQAADPVSQPLWWWNTIVAALFGIWLTLTVLSGFCAFRCILPFRRKGVHPALEHCSHFHPAAISAKYSIDDHRKFVSDYAKGGVEGFQREILGGLLIDSHISANKYKSVTLAIRLLGWSALVALIYLITIQF